jgi:hypothetical protein
MSVVLPAPFGRISAWRLPATTLSVTRSVATKPPNRFTSSRVCKGRGDDDMTTATDVERRREAFYGRADTCHLAPLWDCTVRDPRASRCRA